jgi:ATP-dependent Clp protease ATP-binding subunit ClpA
MGVSKQAAQKRFVTRPGDTPDLDPSQGFARFTPRTRNVVMAAQEEARSAGNALIGVEHLVLGLLSEPESFGVQALLAQAIDPADVRAAATDRLPPPVEDVPDLIPYDQGAQKALELTFREALRLGHNYVGTEHLLLALLDLEDGAGVLSGLGVDRQRAESMIVDALAALTSQEGS